MSKSQVGAQAQTAKPVSNLASYSLVQLPADTSYNEAVQILKGLQSSDDVELAYMEPIYKPADISTQPYLDTQSNSNGVDAVDANPISGGKGDNVRVTDVEGGWQIGHEDLPITSKSLYSGSNSSDPNWVNHGTAVLGIIAAEGGVDPAYDIVGIAPHAELHMVSALSMDTATAIYEATLISRAGDIIVIPLEALGPASGDTPQAGCDPTHFEDIPVEYWQANFDAIQTATADGIIVIEAAGDGGMNLDDTITPTHPTQIYGDAFKRSHRDSGAIIVGAGQSGQTDTARTPMCFSNYGSRVDLQGWGEDIATTGGDGDQNIGTPNQTYTDDFGGTSGAAAMVAGAAASLQGIYKNFSSVPISPDDLRDLLVGTGAPQTGDATHNHIGPLPNLGQASLQVSTPSLLGPADGSTVNTLKPTLDWSYYLNANSFEVEVATGTSFNGNVVVDHPTSGTEYTLSNNLSSGQIYYWRVQGSITTTTIDPVTLNHVTTTTYTHWSPVFSFTVSVQADKASAPKLYKPDDKTTSIEDPSFTFFSPILSWYDPSITTNLSEYHIEISSSYLFAANDTNLGIDTTTFSIGYPDGETAKAGISNSSLFTITLNNEDDTYYWHVAACYGTGLNEYCSPWSSRRIIYTGLVSPDTLAEDSTQELRPTFSWNEVDSASATAYDLQVVQVNGSSHKVITSATISLPSGQTVVPTTYTLTKDLPKNLSNLDFRVAVRGKTSIWVWSDYSGALFNTGAPPPTVSLVSPKNKSVDSDYPFTPIFTWKPTKDNVTKDYVTDTYNIQYSNASDFEPSNGNIITTEVDGIGPATGPNDLLTYQVPALTPLNPQTIYYWRVQSVGSSNSDWSTWVLYTAVQYPYRFIRPVGWQ